MKSYTVKVSGIVWAGYKASTEYTFNHQPTRAEVLTRTGDFQHVAKTTIRCTETKVTSCGFAEVQS